MLQNFRSRPRNIKLDKQAGLPSVKLLEDMRQKAMVNAGAIVELPFGDDAQSFNLTVTRDVTHGSWLWMMYRDDGFNSGLEWSHVTHDADYIYTLISNANLGFMMSKPPQQAMPVAAPQNQQTALPQPVDEQAAKARKGTLQGNLKNIQMSNLFQSISMGQMTGRLEILAPQDKAIVFFRDGNPVHATIRGAEGTEALIQLQAWDDGEFTFYNERINVTETINRGLIGLLMEGATFVDHLKYTVNAGLTHDAYLVPIEGVDVEAALKNGIDCQLGDVVTLYKLADGSKTWAEILRDLDWAKSRWVPVMFNLLSCGLVRVSSTPTRSARPLVVESKMDWSVLQSFEQSISRADTGLFTHPALLFFLSQEWFKFESMEVPFSLIVFGYCDKAQDSMSKSNFIPFRGQAIRELREKLMRVRRKYDLLCHFGAFSYAMILPMTVKNSAIRQAEILAEICSRINISEEYPPDRLEFRVSVVNIPEDCNTLDEVLTIAEKVSSLGS
ncbi:MAG TPA: DUF4388 domain-containing protein [Chroococcales cyanobacterium]